MAEPTEQEQIKQTQFLETVSKGQTNVSGKLDKVIAVLKEEGTQEAVLSEMKEQDEILLKTVKGLKRVEEELIDTTKKIHKQGEEQQKTNEEVIEQTEQHQDVTEEKLEEQIEVTKGAGKTLIRGNDLIEAFKISQDESADQTATYQDIMQGVEKRKADLAKTALADQKRKDKLSTRMTKGAWDWAKGKGNAVIKATGSFFENLLKLLGLLGLWMALSWLKGKNLKKIFDDFKKKIQTFIDDWIPQWIQDLDWGWQLGIALGGLAAAWFGLKWAVKRGAKSLLRVATGMTKSLGAKGVLSTQLDDVVKQLDNLAAQKNTLKKLHDLEDNVGKKSKLATQIDDVDIKIKALTDQENALKRSLKIDTALNMDSDLATQIDEADTKIKKLTADKNNIMKKTGALKGKLDANSKMAKQLDIVIDSIDELTKQRGVLQATLEMNKKTMIDLANQDAAAKRALPKKGARWNPKLQRWTDPVTGGTISETEALQRTGQTPEAKRVGRTLTPDVPIDSSKVPVKTPGFLDNLWGAVKNSPLVKGAKIIGKGAMTAADAVARKVLIPLEIIRGIKAGWVSSEGKDWDIRIGDAVRGGAANTADLLLTDTMRGVEAVSGMVHDLFTGEKFGTKQVTLGSKEVKEFFENKLGAFKGDTTLEAMLERGDISWWDLIGQGEGGAEKSLNRLQKALGALEMDRTKGRLKEVDEDRAKLKAEGGAFWLADTEKGAAARTLIAVSQQMEKAAEAAEKARVQQRQQGGANFNNVIPIDKSQTTVVGKSNDTDPMLGYIIPASVQY